MKIHPPHANEEGSVLLLTLVLLVLLTIAGLGALSVTNTELTITGNDRCFKQNLTRAESAIMEAAQTMENSSDPEAELKPPTSGTDNTLTWVNSDPDSSVDFDPLTQDWSFGTNAIRSGFFTDNLSGYTALYKGIAPGASLDMGNTTTMRQYEVYGRAEQCNGLLDVIAGYRIRF
ncbi:hypothetical protein DSLASN_27810 [Desulfoluna limicola]|uniref:Type 4 fimbrial biogenesis protein PilX N-terminal domain-containing protein n=1 Tax=Desulfoluna limicola TaxID=2810562 RepID=A0ABN6F8Q4_9BACT|nr:hypothetical protein [Desulfoluna limicola]BCS97149.1 hypothetical protein DSLASN_27810 [Desulfoluna limicola]